MTPSVIEPAEFWYMKVVRFSSLHTGHLYPPSHTTGINFSQRSSRLKSHSAVRILKSIKTPSDPIGNRTRGISVCSAMPQWTAPILICRLLFLIGWISAAPDALFVCSFVCTGFDEMEIRLWMLHEGVLKRPKRLILEFFRGFCLRFLSIKQLINLVVI